MRRQAIAGALALASLVPLAGCGDDGRSVDEIVAGDLGAVFAGPPAAVILVPPTVDGESADPIVAVDGGPPHFTHGMYAELDVAR